MSFLAPPEVDFVLRPLRAFDLMEVPLLSQARVSYEHYTSRVRHGHLLHHPLAWHVVRCMSCCALHDKLIRTLGKLSFKAYRCTTSGLLHSSLSHYRCDAPKIAPRRRTYDPMIAVRCLRPRPRGLACVVPTESLSAKSLSHEHCPTSLPTNRQRLTHEIPYD